MVGLSATLRAEGKPASTVVSLVVLRHETSVSFSVSWDCFATILLGRVVVRMNEEVHVNPQLIQESPLVITVFTEVLTSPDRCLSWNPDTAPAMENLDSL